MGVNRRWLAAGAAALWLGTAGSASAAIIGVELLQVAPPASIGGYAMTPFGPDLRPELDLVTDIDSPVGGGSVSFSSALEHRNVDSTWSTWSHGYTGDVYADLVAPYTVTLGLPAWTKAFYLYLQPNAYGLYRITVTDQDGDGRNLFIDGFGGARGRGFYATGGDFVQSISVEAVDGSTGFALGEFGIAVPEPATLLLLGAGLLCLSLRARRRVG